MALARSRHRRRRRILLLAGLAAIAAASALWYRSIHGAFPWSPPLAAGDGAAISLLGMRDPAEAVGSPERAPVPSPVPPDVRQLAASRPQDAQPTPSENHGPPATRPTGRRPAHLDPAQARMDAESGFKALQKGDLVNARELLSRACQAGLSGELEQRARREMANLAAETLFSGRVLKDDPFTQRVLVQPGDTLGGIAGRYHIPQDFVAFVNRIRDRNIIQLGQHLKVVRGPFHATVSKSRHIMDLYLQNAYVRSFPVALGMDGSTPTGTWKVSNRQEDPGWADPRTGQRWHPADPNNPIGEHWIGLAGVEGDAVGQVGYGIHGTIEPETIGKDVSMGCIRLAPEDVALLYKCLLPGDSYVVITD